MKKLLILPFIILSLLAKGQYDPSKATVTNKPLGIAQGVPTDARSYYYSPSLFIWRPYQSTAEVLATLNIAKYRMGNFPIYVSTGTLQSNGAFVGGVIKEYWFKDGTADGNLIEKVSGGAGETTSGTVAQLRALTTTLGRSYTSTDKGGGSWTDIGVYDGQVDDDGATYIVTTANRILQRQINGAVDPQWFGAIPNDNVNDISAFNAAVAFCKTLKGTPTIHIKGGRWRLNSRWIVDGFAWADNFGNGTWTGIKVEGDGASNSILDFSASTTGGLFYGSSSTNTWNAGVSDIGIIGNQNIDGFTLVSTAPYTTRNNHFDNLYFAQVRDGIKDSTGVSFLAGNHDNFYSNPLVEGYWRYGIHQTGVYNMVTGAFIVHPNGTGAQTLAIFEEGQGNTYDNPTFEDQFWIKGYDNVFNNFKMEKVIKSTGFNLFFGQAFQIDGVNNKLLGGKLNDIDNSIVSVLGYVTGSNVNISNVQYRNEEGTANHIMPNPIIPEDISSGVMDNVITNTTSKMDREGFYEKGLLNWSVRNVDGENGLWSKSPGEIRVETPPITGSWKAGVKAINKTPLPGEPPYWTRVIVGTDSSWASSLSSLDQITATGNVTSRVLISNAGMYAPDHHLSGDAGNNISGYFTTLGTSAVLQATNFAGNGGAGLSINKSGGKVGIGKDAGTDSLDVEGTGRFSGYVSAAKATQPTNLLRKDQFDSAFLATSFILRNSQSTGDSLMKIVGPSEAIIKRLSLSGIGVTKQTDNDTTLKYEITVRVQTVSSAATVTPDASFEDGVKILAQSVGLTLANPAGTPVTMQRLLIRIKDNGTARTIAYGTQYRGIGVTLPTTTVAGKYLYLEAVYNADDAGGNKWDVIRVNQEL